ncbi:hypothetical protein [Brevundimonas sp.]|uniref:hypothetical protein n=1 Tax=Brevundimonas sp. TaxID=1871086 RepID=UPI00289A0B9D|nr:hypothetical protein [Brevundimonas sp.]
MISNGRGLPVFFHAAADAEGRALLVERAPLERELVEIDRKLKRAQTMCLDGAMEGEDGEEVRSELRNLIDRVDFIPVAGLGKFQLEAHGSLAGLLAL